jgi:hypothetical protein
VYLADVPKDSSSSSSGAANANNDAGTDELGRSRWKADFQESKWSTRGWTSQELRPRTNQRNGGVENL